MVKSFNRLLSILMLVLFALALAFQTADARRWAFGDSRRWLVMRACRDGAVVLAIHTQATGPDFILDPDRATISLQARRYTNPAAPPPSLDDGRLDAAPEEYGELLLDDISVQLEMHSAPLSADEDESGTIDPFEGYYAYALTTVEWAPLDVSAGPQKILLIHNNLNTGSVAYAENCSLRSLFFPNGRPAVLTQDKLDLHEENLQPEEIYYRLETPPSFGALELNGTALSAGDTFTQADVNGRRLEYIANDPDAPQADYFAAARHGIALLSTGINGENAAGPSYMPSISSDGRYVAFASQAGNLTPGDENTNCDNDYDGIYQENCADIFVHDQATGQTTLVSQSSDGTQTNAPSDLPAISGDGAWVAYRSSASNLAGGDAPLCESALPDTNGVSDIFRSRVAGGDTLRYSIGPKVGDICLEGDEPVFGVDISLDGMLVGFSSLAWNLSSYITDYNASPDVFLHVVDELVGSQTYVVSRDPVNPATTNGSSGALPDGFGDYSLRDVSLSDGDGSLPVVAFASDSSFFIPGDLNFASDVFVTTQAGLKRISVNDLGYEANGASYSPSISADGRFIAFVSEATNLSELDTDSGPDIYVYDRDADMDGVYDGEAHVELVSRNFDGFAAGNGAASYPSISPDGRFIAFASDASDMVPVDENGTSDVFLYDQDFDGDGEFGLLHDDFDDRTQTVMASISFDFQAGDEFSTWPSVSRGGKFVAFVTAADNLTPGDENGAIDVYAYYPGDTVFFPILPTEAVFLSLPLMVK